VHNGSSNRRSRSGDELGNGSESGVWLNALMMPSLISLQMNRHQAYVHSWPRGDTKSNPLGNPVDSAWGAWWKLSSLFVFIWRMLTLRQMNTNPK